MCLTQTLILFSLILTSTYGVHVAVRNGMGPYCIVMNADINGSIDYYDNAKNETISYNFVVNGTVNSSGECHIVEANKSIETVEILFIPNDISPKPEVRERWSLAITFEEPPHGNEDDKVFRISNYSLTAHFYSEYFNTSTDSEVYSKLDDAELEWSASVTHGYTCTNSPLPLQNNSVITFSNLKVIAFAMLEDDNFPEDQLFEQCRLDMRTSDLVPIIVGACLAGLVIVVLIAYVIGRARAKRQGYASV